MGFLNQTKHPPRGAKPANEPQSDRVSMFCPVCGQSRAQNWLQAPDRFHGRRKPYGLLRCPACLLVWLENPPLPEEMGGHYGKAYDRLIADGGAASAHWKGRRDQILSLKSRGAILDLGCSSGGFLAALKDPSRRLFGIEMSEAVAREAEKRSGAQVFVGNILDAPFQPASFDAITCFHVFEHLYEPGKVLAKISDWLKPGGVFYAMMPNIDSAGARIFGSYWYALELPRHLYHFSPKSLRYLANSVDLEEVSLTTHREVFIEPSVRYFLDDALRRIGIERTPMAQAPPPSVAWKVLRKSFRLTMLPLLTAAASLAGDGESIHAVFSKRASPPAK
jgi:SAM-dependent methyltransferase